MDIQDYNFAEKSIHNYARILGAIANFYTKERNRLQPFKHGIGMTKKGFGDKNYNLVYDFFLNKY